MTEERREAPQKDEKPRPVKRKKRKRFEDKAKRLPENK